MQSLKITRLIWIRKLQFLLGEIRGKWFINICFCFFFALIWYILCVFTFLRPSSPSLAKAVIDGITSINGKVTDYGVVSTPQLHFFVTCRNTNNAYGSPDEEGYFSKLATAFKNLRGPAFNQGSYQNTLLLDGANGVGALKMKILQDHLGNSLDTSIFNSGNGKLNFQCGADYVKVNQKAPQVHWCPSKYCIT